jgi:hypothetical protein
MEVLVFKTSVESPQHVKVLRPLLDSVAGRGGWNFALDDSDKILRIVSGKLTPQGAIRLLNEKGYECSELED